MAFMLVAVVLFFILVGLFWLTLQYRNLQSQAGELERNKAALMAEFLSDSTEFSCGSYCIDTDRLLVLQNNSVYREFWPVSYIRVRKIYPVQPEKECNIENYPDCNVFNVYENKNIESSSAIGSFVSLCRYERVGDYPLRVCDLGRILIGYELK